MTLLNKIDPKINDSLVDQKKNKIKHNVNIATDSAVNVLAYIKELKSIEFGKVDLKLEPVNIKDVFEITQIIFEKALSEKNIALTFIVVRQMMLDK